jgi:Tannase-like family of unknown function (DUF6351)
MPRLLAGVLSLSAFTLLCAASAAYADDVRIEALSTHADRVSGGDVLVQVSFEHPWQAQPLTVTAGGRDVTSAFRAGASPGTLVGLVTGLALGKNQLVVEGKGLGKKSLTITNYPSTGPIVTGPHTLPFICETHLFRLPDGTTLTSAPATDIDCSAPTKVTYVYVSTTGPGFKALPSTSSLPADVAMITTSAGVTVPYVVRVETGTMNRGIYQNAILFNPVSDAAPTPFSPPRGWNRRLVAIHGAGCPGGWYTQGAAEGVNVLQDMYLSKGYALFINSLQNPSNHCNGLVAAESAMMGKEHFIETFGVPDFTVSTGGSGGAYTSLQVSDMLPGLIDGAFINATFPDAAEIALSGLDGHLLTHYFAVTNPAAFTVDQQVAVSGYKGQQAWIDAANQSQRTDPVPGRKDIAGYSPAVWNAIVPVALRYDPVTNPQGARPTVYDISRNIYGIDPRTGFALRTFDNVGVQYGLAALNSGAISTSQFLDLNAGIGGFDQDANYVSARSEGNRGAIRRAYQSGLQLNGGGGLASIPIIDFGFYNDTSGYHYQWHHFAVRQRLVEANGNADNHIFWRGNDATSVPLNQAFATMAQWVAAIKTDTSHRSLREKVLLNKPPTAVDGCYDASNPPQFIAEPQTFSSLPDSRCNTLWPSYGFPRLVAGGPLSANILKCELKPIDAGDYKVTFSAAEMQRLRALFPSGVCDWSKRGVERQGIVGWASFGPSKDNLVWDVTHPDEHP